jgi:hypothetical protein
VKVAQQDWRDVYVAAGFGSSSTVHEQWTEFKLSQKPNASSFEMVHRQRSVPLRDRGGPLDKELKGRAWEMRMRYSKVTGPGERDEDWGDCVWLEEIDDRLWTVRQLQIYENGIVLSYDLDTHPADEYGGLPFGQNEWILGPEDIGPDYAFEEITQEAFEREWENRIPMNRKADRDEQGQK